MKNKMTIFIILSVLLFAPSSSAEERFFEVKAKKFSYTPNMIKVNKGDLIRIRLISEDVQHGFFVDGYNLNTTAYPGKEGSLAFTADKTGRFSFRCSVTCGEFHPYMVGYLMVERNLRFLFYLFLTAGLGLANIFLILRRKKERENG